MDNNLISLIDVNGDLMDKEVVREYKKVCKELK